MIIYQIKSYAGLASFEGSSVMQAMPEVIVAMLWTVLICYIEQVSHAPLPEFHGVSYLAAFMLTMRSGIAYKRYMLGAESLNDMECESRTKESIDLWRCAVFWDGLCCHLHHGASSPLLSDSRLPPTCFSVGVTDMMRHVCRVLHTPSTAHLKPELRRQLLVGVFSMLIENCVKSRDNVEMFSVADIEAMVHRAKFSGLLKDDEYEEITKIGHDAFIM